MIISVIVKGDRFQAAQAMSAAGIPFAFHRETSHGETIGLVNEEHTAAVQRVYHLSDGQSPQPVGAVLCWSTGRVSSHGIAHARAVREKALA